MMLGGNDWPICFQPCCVACFVKAKSLSPAYTPHPRITAVAWRMGEALETSLELELKHKRNDLVECFLLFSLKWYSKGTINASVYEGLASAFCGGGKS